MLADARPTLLDRFEALRVDPAQRELLSDTRVLPLPPLRFGELPCNADKLRPSIRDAFVGRADEMWQLHDALSTTRMGGADVAALTGALQGGGGFGKTRLAVEYAWRLGPSAYPGGVFWIDASESDQVSMELRHVLRAAVEPRERALVDELPEPDLRHAVRAALCTCAADGEVLFVVDNLPECLPGAALPALDHFCPALGDVTCLITSRNLHGFGGSVQAVSVDVLDPDSAVALLTRGVKRDRLSSDDWRAIAEWTGRLPLVLELLNGMLTMGGAEPAEVLARSREREVAAEVDRYASALRGQVPDRDLRTTSQVFLLSFEALDEASRQVALRLAWCAPDPIPQELLSALTGEEDLDRVRAQLVGRSFLTRTREQGAFRMHRVLASFLRGMSDAPEHPRAVLVALAVVFTAATEQRELALALIPHVEAQVRPLEGPGSEGFGPWRPLGNALTTVAEQEADRQPLLLLIRLRKGQLARAQDPESEDWAEAMGNLGTALARLGEREGDGARLEEAVGAYRAALRVRTEERLPLQWATTQNNLGNALLSLGEREGDGARLEEAVGAYRAALRVYTLHGNSRSAIPSRSLARTLDLLRRLGGKEDPGDEEVERPSE
jgi:tetratricopeptide (TPR) repeat protein